MVNRVGCEFYLDKAIVKREQDGGLLPENKSRASELPDLDPATLTACLGLSVFGTLALHPGFHLSL